jgi:hypothetical protein
MLKCLVNDSLWVITQLVKGGCEADSQFMQTKAGHLYSFRKSGATFAALTIWILILSSLTSSAAQPERMWVLHQYHHHIGNVRVYLSRSAVKLVSETNGYEILSKAPRWQVLFFRPDSKTACEISLARFEKQGILDSSAFVASKEEIMTQERTAKLLGITATVWKCDRPGRSARFWTAEDMEALSMAPFVVRCFYQLEVLNAGKGVPLMCMFRQPRSVPVSSSHSLNDTLSFAPDGDVCWLKTTEIKSMPLSPAVFTAPQNLHYLKTSGEIVISQDQVHQLEGALDDLGVGSKLGK